MPDLFNPSNYPIIFIQPLRIKNSAWIEHVPFGMFLIDLLRPRIVVELGTHTGISYCAFCQAVKQLELDTKCFAVDTWQGDKHSSLYGPDVFDELSLYHDPLYGQFSKLLKSTFDDAVRTFSDGCIDLLHIDGLHTYEAVKNDFETWLPKLSSKAVVVFHDTNVHLKDFGVWKFWGELKLAYPSFEFLHGYGLGVLAVGHEYPPALNLLLKSVETDKIRELFRQTGLMLHEQMTVQIQAAQMKADEAAIRAMEDRITRIIGQLGTTKAAILRDVLWKGWRMTRRFRNAARRIKKHVQPNI